MCIMRKPVFCMKKGYQAADLLLYLYATQSVQFFYLLNLKFQSSNHLCLYSLVYAEPEQKDSFFFTKSLIILMPFCRMLYFQTTIPHSYVTIDCNVDPVTKLRKQLKGKVKLLVREIINLCDKYIVLCLLICN